MQWRTRKNKGAEAEFLRDRINNTCSESEEIAGYLHESQFPYRYHGIATLVACL